MLILVDLGRVAGSYDVTLQSDYPRNVVFFFWSRSWVLHALITFGGWSELPP